jgi:hypothetical protein
MAFATPQMLTEAKKSRDARQQRPVLPHRGFFGLAVLPVVVIFFGYTQALSRLPETRLPERTDSGPGGRAHEGVVAGMSTDVTTTTGITNDVA